MKLMSMVDVGGSICNNNLIDESTKGKELHNIQMRIINFLLHELFNL